MTAATLNKINSHAAAFEIEIVRGHGYFYAIGTSDAGQAAANRVPSVYSLHLRCMSLEGWRDHISAHAGPIRT